VQSQVPSGHCSLDKTGKLLLLCDSGNNIFTAVHMRNPVTLGLKYEKTKPLVQELKAWCDVWEIGN
jgi:hypothetical protein